MNYAIKRVNRRIDQTEKKLKSEEIREEIKKKK